LQVSDQIIRRVDWTSRNPDDPEKRFGVRHPTFAGSRDILKNKNQELHTFDNLFDSMKRNSPFIGRDLKANAEMYHPNDNHKKLRLQLTQNGAQEVNEDDEESGDESKRDLEKDSLKELEKMAMMLNEDILKKAGKKKKENVKEEVKTEVDQEKEKRKLQLKSDEAQKDLLNEEKEEEFEISRDDKDDYDDQIRKKDLEEVFLDNIRIKMMLKKLIRKQKASKKMKLDLENYRMNDLREDEDFRTIGNVVLNVVSAKIPEKDKTEKAEDLKKTQVNLKETQNEKKEKGENKPFEKEEEKDKKATPASLQKKEPATAEPQREAQGASENAIPKAINLPTETDKMIKEGEKVEVVEKLEKKKKQKKNMYKKEQKKSQKKRKDNKSKLTAEEIDENANVAYYIKNKYQCLKMEVAYQYEKIPVATFNSILDIVPIYVREYKDLKEREEEDKFNKQTLKLQYHLSSLKKKAKKKSNVAPAVKTNELATSKSTISDGSDSDSFSDSMSTSKVGSKDATEEEKLKPSRKKNMTSTTKITNSTKLRKQVLEENERFIKRKPFPVKMSPRINEVLQSMKLPQEETVTLGKTNTIAPKTQGFTRRRVDYAEDVSAVAERFFNDMDECRRKLEESELKYDKNDYSHVYKMLKSKDMESKEISRFNWSGDQIIPNSNFTLSQTSKTIGSLNLQKFSIWLQGWNGVLLTLRRYAAEFIDSSFVNTFLMISVFLNTAMMAADGLTPTNWTNTLNLLNTAFTIIFTAELVFKLFGYGPKKYSQDYFNLFDAFVVAISLVEIFINSSSAEQTSTPGGNKKTAASAFRVVRIFRIFRVLRVTRLLRSLQFMKVIIEVLGGTIEQFTYITTLMFLFIFIFTLLGMQIFGNKFTFNNETSPTRFNFDSFASAFYTVFVILTMENWNDTLVNCLRTDVSPIMTMVYLIIWIFIGNYIFLNLFLAILLDGFESCEAVVVYEEIDNEHKEYEAMQKKRIEIEEEKRALEIKSDEAVKTQMMLIIEPDSFKNVAAMNKNQAVYQIIRNNEYDGESFEEEVNLKSFIKQTLNSKKGKLDIFEGVDCEQTFYYFTKKNAFRRFCAYVCSHPK
jgi:hypothetical protein